MGCHCKKSFSKKGLFFGVLFALMYILCFFWYYALKAPVLQEMYLNMHRVSFVWWNGMDFASFISGLVQSFIWGWVLVVILWLSRKICGCGCGCGCKGECGCGDKDNCEAPKA